MLVPPVIPAATLIFLATRGGQTLVGGSGAGELFQISFWLVIGLMCAANQWALRFRARTGDWADNPAASHKFRTYLGVMQASVFTFIGGRLCVFIATQGQPIYFRITLAAEALWLVFVWRIHFWLRKHLARDSSDPMPDACGKWGSFYFNPGDSALVVPMGTGVGQSFNFARPSVVLAFGFFTVMFVASLWLS